MPDNGRSLRTILRSFLRRKRPVLQRQSFRLHGLDLCVTTDREEMAQAVQTLLGHAATRRSPARGRLECQVHSWSPATPFPLDRFPGARLVASGETTGYFAWQGLCLIDFYPWATAAIDPRQGFAVLIVNEAVSPSPLLFSNQILFQTLEVLLQARGLYPIHAAAVAQGRTGVLFPAESGAGKTTIALTLVRAGFRFLGDDKPIIAIRAGRPVILSFPEPIQTYVDELGAFQELPDRSYPGFAPDVPLKTAFRADDFKPGCVVPSARPGALIFPDGRTDGASLIEPIPRADGLRRLIELNWPIPWGFDRFLDLMTDLTARTPCYRLRCGRTLEELPERVSEVVGQS